MSWSRMDWVSMMHQHVCVCVCENKSHRQVFQCLFVVWFCTFVDDMQVAFVDRCRNNIAIVKSISVSVTVHCQCLQHRSMCAWVRTDCLRLHQKASISTIKSADLNDQRDTDADFKDQRCWFVDVNVGTIFYSIIKYNAMWTYRILEKHANLSPELQEHTLSTPQSLPPWEHSSRGQATICSTCIATVAQWQGLLT